MNDANSMDGSFVSQKDLIPVINDDPKLRRAFVKQFEKLVWFAARKVYLKHRNLEFEDICMELWVVVFEKQCLLLRKFRGNSKFSTYFAVCLSHAAMDVARRISREAKGLPIVEQKSGGLMFDWLDAATSSTPSARRSLSGTLFPHPKNQPHHAGEITCARWNAVGWKAATTCSPIANAKSCNWSPKVKPIRRVAGLLNISLATVETHRTHILQKLGLRGIPGADPLRHAQDRFVISFMSSPGTGAV